jgi:hypothetical protein
LVLDPSPSPSIAYPLSVPSVRPSVRVPEDDYRNTGNTGNITIGSPNTGLGARPLTANGSKAPAGLGSGRERSDSFSLRREERRGLVGGMPSYLDSTAPDDEQVGGDQGSMALMGDRVGVSSVTSGDVSAVSRPVRAVAGSKIPAPKQALTDAQKDSIVRQIRSASAGRVGRDPSNSTVQQPQIAVSDGDSPAEMDFVRAEGSAYSADNAGQGVGYAGPQKGPQGKWGAQVPGVGSAQDRPGSRESQLWVQVPGQKSSPKGLGWGNQRGAVSPARSAVQGAGTSPRSVRDNSNSAKGVENLKHDARNDRDRDRDRDTREERGQREEKSEGRRPGALVTTAVVDDDEAKRLEKFEKMRQKKIAEAQARALVSPTDSPLCRLSCEILQSSL